MVGPEKMIKKNKLYEKKFTNYIQFKAQPKKNKIKWNKKKSTKTKQKLYEPKMEFCKKTHEIKKKF